MYNHLIGAGFDRWSVGSYTPGQLEFLADSTSPAILFSGAYRAGKTEVACRAVIRHAMTYPGAKVGVFRAKLKSLKQSTLRTFLELVHPSWVANWNNSELELLFVNGSTVTFLGCDFPDRIGSIELSAAFIDEAHEANPEAYGMIVGRLSAPLQINSEWLNQISNLTQYANAAVGVRQLWLACNPKSQSHWLYRDFINPDTRLPGRKFYSSNTLTNTNLPQSYVETNLSQYARPGTSLEKLRETVTNIRQGRGQLDGMNLVPLLTPFGQRNLLGLWVALEGAIFELDRSLHLVPANFGEWGKPTKIYAGVDFGFHHPRIVVASKFSNNSLLTVDYWDGSNSTPEDLVLALTTLDEKWHLSKIFMPHDQPGIKKMARKKLGGSRIMNAQNSVLTGIGQVQALLGKGALKFVEGSSSFDLFWGELEGYSWKRDRDGNWLDEPVKEDDHYPDALRYLVASMIHFNFLPPLNAGLEPHDPIPEIDLPRLWKALPK